MTQTQGTCTLHISPVNPAATYHMSAQLNGYSCSFLVDTGASISLIDTTTLVRCKLSRKRLLPWNQQHLMGVDGSLLCVQGSLSVQLNCSGHTFVVPVVVVQGLQEEAILGLDFLQSHRCNIDCQQHVLRFFGQDINVPLDFTGKTTVAVAAVLNDTTIVPAHSEIETLAVVPDGLPRTGTWLLECHLSHSKVNSNIIVARAIVNSPAQVVIQLINTTSTPSTVYKNTKVALLSPLSEDQILVSAVGTSTTMTSPITATKKFLWEIATKSNQIS